MLGNKEGLATKDEIKVLWSIASGELPIPTLVKPIVTMLLPGFIDGLDNKYGDKVPEPWQSHLENMVTMVIKALEDKVVSEQEAEEIAAYMAVVIDEKIDIPYIDDETEAIVFLEVTKLIASLIYSAFKKKSTDSAELAK